MRDARVQRGFKGPTFDASEPLENAEVRSAFDAFLMTRSAALLLAIIAAVVLSNPPHGGGYAHVAASLVGLALAVYVARGGRKQLRAALSKDALRRGMLGPEARLHAEASFERLTWQEPRHALSWVPYRASPKPSHEPVLERPRITITALDRERLSHLLTAPDASFTQEPSLLERELARAHVLPSASIAPDIVTMNSRVRFADEDEGQPREVTLVYPTDADSEAECVSVLSPIGSALLGLKVGQAIEWPFLDGHRERYRVLDVAYQPEASGHFHL